MAYTYNASTQEPEWNMRVTHVGRAWTPTPYYTHPLKKNLLKVLLA